MLRLEVSACVICGQSKRQGLSICQQFVCDECELAIIGADSQSEDYNVLLNKLKVVWQGFTNA